MSDSIVPIRISGKLSANDLKRMTNAMRGSTVGPTTLYCAGVTAPVIGAGMALLGQVALQRAGASDYWQWMLSALVAAMAGIVWYLIFMRWAYRHKHGRASEVNVGAEVEVSDGQIIIRRGKIETRIDASAIKEVKTMRGATLVKFEGTDPLFVPDRWFGKDKAARADFIQVLNGSFG